MASTVDPPLAREATSVGARHGRPLTPAELAWLAAIPCALVVVAAIVELGPALGAWLFPPSPIHIWGLYSSVMPEPTEHARYLLAALGPVLLAGAIVLLSRRAPRQRPIASVAIFAAQALTLAFVAFTVVAQHTLAFHTARVDYPHRVYFTTATLVVSALLAVLLAGALHRRAVFARLTAALRDTPLRRVAAATVAAAFTGLWLLTAVNTDGSIGRARDEVTENIPYWLDETFAVLDGTPPLVSFHAQYGQLWPYAAAGVMALVGASLGVYTVTSVLATGAAMLAVYSTFRRVVRNSLVALGLFLPFVATSFFKEHGSLAERYGPSNLFSIFPMRYAGAYVLAWLVARHLERPRQRHAWLLMAFAGLVTINNLEFGVPALAATFAALVWTLPRPIWPSARRLVAATAVGLVCAVALLSALTLAVAGSLPHLGLLFEFSRLYAVSGFGLLPMPTFGFHLAIYLTFAAAIGVATVRAVSDGYDRLLTGMLCWAGVFGIGAGAYYAGRSHPDVLIDLFSAWAFALALLLVAAVRSTAGRRSRWPTAAELAVFLAFGAAICSIAQTPTPWSQIARLRNPVSTPLFNDQAIEPFIRRYTHPGERVGIVGPMGHRIAYQVGVHNVSPYAQPAAMIVIDQWDNMLRAFRQQHVHTMFIWHEVQLQEMEYLERHGWKLKAPSPGWQVRLLTHR